MIKFGYVCMPHNDTKESLLFRVYVAVQHLHALLHFVDFFQWFSFYLKRTHTDPHICMCWFFDSFSHASKTHDARLGSPLHYCQSSFSHTCCSSHHTTLSGCLHTVPFAHPNTHAHTQMQKHALHCQVLYAHTHTHTLCGGKSLALAAYYLSYKFASTGGCHGDNKANTVWPVNPQGTLLTCRCNKPCRG